MIIPDDLAQKIVDSTMCLVQRNINIMNREGIIIATGHSHRHHTFHKGAKDVLDTGNMVEIYPSELSLYPGALQGVNLPIVFEEQIVGVVGVFGHPDEVRSTGKLVKTITELILDRELLLQKLRTKHLLREQFIDLALQNNATGSQNKLLRIAKNLGITPILPRTVTVFDTTALIKKSIIEYGSSELVIERITDSIIGKLFQAKLLTKEDLAAIPDEKLIIIKHIASNAPPTQLLAWGQAVTQTLDNRSGQTIFCGIGAIVSEINDYYASYRHALYTLKQCTETKPLQSIYDYQQLVDFIFYETTPANHSLALNAILAQLSHSHFSGEDMQLTLSTLLDCNLCVNQAASRLHLHRNTLLYRLNRLKEETNLDPLHRLHDAILCKLLLALNSK
mgnify:CR=1 FL=1